MGDQRVVIVSHGFQAHYELGFANGLAENGVQVVLLGSDTTLAGQLHPGVEFLNIRGSQDPKRPRWKKAVGMVAYHARLLREAWRHRRQPMVVIGLLNPEWIVGVIEMAALKWCSGQLALVVHNILPHNRDTVDIRRVYAKIYAIPHWLLVHTEATRRDLVREFAVAIDRTVLVPHGLNDAISLPSGTRAEAKVALGLQSTDPTVLMFGLASHYKGSDLLLDAVEQQPALRLLVAGRCPHDAFGQNIRERLGRLVAAGRAVWFDGYVDEATAGRLFAATDVTVLPYRQIDQSGVLLLSLTLGVPVLVSNLGGLAEFVNPRNGRFISTIDTEGVLAGIESIFGGRDLFDAATVRSTVSHLEWKSTILEYINHLPPVQSNSATQIKHTLRGR